MKTTLVIATVLLLLVFAAPAASAGPGQCMAVEPWWGICNGTHRLFDDVRNTVEDLEDEIPPVP